MHTLNKITKNGITIATQHIECNGRNYLIKSVYKQGARISAKLLSDLSMGDRAALNYLGKQSLTGQRRYETLEKAGKNPQSQIKTASQLRQLRISSFLKRNNLVE